MIQTPRTNRYPNPSPFLSIHSGPPVGTPVASPYGRGPLSPAGGTPTSSGAGGGGARGGGGGDFGGSSNRGGGSAKPPPLPPKVGRLGASSGAHWAALAPHRSRHTSHSFSPRAELTRHCSLRSFLSPPAVLPALYFELDSLNPCAPRPAPCVRPPCPPLSRVRGRWVASPREAKRPSGAPVPVVARQRCSQQPRIAAGAACRSLPFPTPPLSVSRSSTGTIFANISAPEHVISSIHFKNLPLRSSSPRSSSAGEGASEALAGGSEGDPPEQAGAVGGRAAERARVAESGEEARSAAPLSLPRAVLRAGADLGGRSCYRQC